MDEHKAKFEELYKVALSQRNIGTALNVLNAMIHYDNQSQGAKAAEKPKNPNE